VSKSLANKTTARGKSLKAIGAAALALPLLMGTGVSMAQAAPVNANDNAVTDALENTGNHILKSFTAGELKPGTSLDDLYKVVPDAFVVPSNIDMAIVYIPDSPSQFALCGWGSGGGKDIGTSQNAAYVYKSTSGGYSPMAIDCGPAGANAVPLNLKDGNLIESGTRPENIPFPEGVAVPSVVAETPAAQTPVPAPAPAPTKAAEPVNFPWVGFAIGAGILVALGVLIFMISLTYKMSRKFKKDAQSASLNISRWNELVERYDSITKEWASYELDPVRILDFPLLSDMNEERTIKFHAALRKAKHLRPSNVKKVSEIAAFGSPFALAVDELENTFHAAETEAKRVRWSKFTPEERKRLQTAKSLLNLAMDSGATEAERQSAYKRMQKELDGLIVIPKATVLALEKKVSLMLTDGNELSANEDKSLIG
jgi:hypothetical protein